MGRSMVPQWAFSMQRYAGLGAGQNQARHCPLE